MRERGGLKKATTSHATPPQPTRTLMSLACSSPMSEMIPNVLFRPPPFPPPAPSLTCFQTSSTIQSASFSFTLPTLTPSCRNTSTKDGSRRSSGSGILRGVSLPL